MVALLESQEAGKGGEIHAVTSHHHVALLLVYGENRSWI